MSKQANPVVKTPGGILEGTVEKGLYMFKGIPFAAPPVGELRWLPPQPPVPWQGIRQAQKYGATAPQNIMPGGPPGMAGFNEVEPQDEDCLFLNVYTPGIDSSRRPVMFWIHGGAFSIGSGSQSMYRGTALITRGNVVLVTINYRLGILGFLNLKEISGGKIPSTGVEGLLDQVAALEWVRDNITAFGGDPANVTIFGESAGGMSIGCLMNLPAARGLFHKVIIESAVGEMARPLGPSVKGSEEFLNIVGLKASDVQALRALSVEKILAAQQELSIRIGQGLAPCIPVADGVVLPKMPLASFEEGQAARVPTLIGSNRDEYKLFAMMDPGFAEMDETALQKFAERMVGLRNAAAVIAHYRKIRAARGEPVTPPELISAINSDLMFRQTALRMVQAQCKYGQPAYNYYFTWKSPAMNGALGACHALEIGFVFGNYEPNFCGAGPAADRLAENIQDAWLAFAHSGNPSSKSLGVWPQYCDQRQTMVFGETSRIEKAPYEDERLIWERIGGEVNTANMP